MKKRLKKKLINGKLTIKQKLRRTEKENSRLKFANEVFYKGILNLQCDLKDTKRSNAVLTRELEKAIEEIKLLNSEINKDKPISLWKKVFR